ncbi:MAG: DUF1028 domain-containing protein [Parvibaculaceae bacterium]
MFLRVLSVAAFLALFLSPASATWSVVAVDAETGEVGIAGASCSTGVRLIAGVVPGKGAVAAQAATSFTGRDLAVEMIGTGERAHTILERLGEEDLYSWPLQSRLDTLQYGVVTLRPSPRAGNLTGANVPNDWGSDHGDDFAVQGNTLRPGVVSAMASAWRMQTVGACRPPFAERLLKTLEAGRDAGGDIRCPLEASSLAAFLIVARPDDEPGSPSLVLAAPEAFSWPELIWHMAAGYAPDPGAPEPVAHLRGLYDARLPSNGCAVR